jgi:hypothetical protein
MRIEVLCEDKSALPVLDQVLKQVLERLDLSRNFEYYLHPHRGLGSLPGELNARPLATKTGLYDLLPAKLRAYQKLAGQEHFVLVIVHDSDDRDPDDCYRQLEYLCRTFAPDHFFVLGISVEELEAWLLGDWPAIKAAYPEADHKLWKSYRQDSVCGTWELLARVLEGKHKGDELIRVGYPAVGIYKSEWARRISPYMKIERNQSPSLQKFIRRLEKILPMAEEEARRA